MPAISQSRINRRPVTPSNTKVKIGHINELRLDLQKGKLTLTEKVNVFIIHMNESGHAELYSLSLESEVTYFGQKSTVSIKFKYEDHIIGEMDASPEEAQKAEEDFNKSKTECLEHRGRFLFDSSSSEATGSKSLTKHSNVTQPRTARISVEPHIQVTPNNLSPLEHKPEVPSAPSIHTHIEEQTPHPTIAHIRHNHPEPSAPPLEEISEGNLEKKMEIKESKPKVNDDQLQQLNKTFAKKLADLHIANLYNSFDYRALDKKDNEISNVIHEYMKQSGIKDYEAAVHNLTETKLEDANMRNMQLKALMPADKLLELNKIG